MTALPVLSAAGTGPSSEGVGETDPDPDPDPTRRRASGPGATGDLPFVGEVDVVVVGAGFAGMYLLHRLRRAGFATLVVEAAEDVGGTWYWNRYPGARCDVTSLDYAYSFDPDLIAEWTWSEKYATQPEILAYANHVADRYHLRADMRFSTRVIGARFDEAAKTWQVTTDRDDLITSRFVILASGCLSAAAEPDIDGIDSFQGWSYHTSSWPRGGVDFAGQRVAVIGTGASAVQAIPIIAEQAAELVVFQRTPNYSIPAGNRPLTSEEVSRYRATDLQARREAARNTFFGMGSESEGAERALSVSDTERRSAYREAWQSGSLVAMLGSYADLLVDPDANATVTDFLQTRIRGMVDDPKVADTLCPTDHPFGAKRPCLDTDYFATFNRDNVCLVDLRRNPITKITPSGVDTSEGHIDLDTIVYATGFDAVTGAITRIDIVGADGRRLAEEWSAGPRTYLGLATHGFPNLFTITGPGSPSVLSNMMVSIEQHVEWVTDCLVHLREKGLSSIEACKDAENDWVDHVRELADRTLLPQADSWYLGANVPGKPRVFLPYAGGVAAYIEVCDQVVAAGYDGFDLQ
jgi:cyclohexanone monooxygenase